MKNNKISIAPYIEEMYRGDEFKKLIRYFQFKFNPNYEISIELEKDFEQDLMLILLEYKDQQKLVELYAKCYPRINKSDEFGLFLMRIISNNLFSRNSPYYQKYGKYYHNKIKTIDEYDKECNEDIHLYQEEE